MTSTRCAAALAAATMFALAACGGGGGTQPATSMPDPPLPGVEPKPQAGIPYQLPIHASQSPVVDMGTRLHVGANVAPPNNFRETFRAPQAAGNINMYLGTVASEVTTREMISYLQHDYRQRGSHPSGYVQRFGAVPPVIRLAAGTGGELTDVVVRAVQIVNAALPHYWQLDISSIPALSGGPRDGEISIEFAPRAQWQGVPGYVEPEAEGVSEALIDDTNRIAKGRIWVDHTLRTSDEERLNAVVHELLHTLGRDHPSPSLYPNSIMNVDGPSVPGHALHPLDARAIQAVYQLPSFVVRVGSLYQDYGHWNNTTRHLVGDLGGGAAFGVATHLPVMSPWASGPTPHSTLADNPALRGTARWSGLIAGHLPYDPDLGNRSPTGLTSGDAGLAVHLADLTGDLDFTGLHHVADSPDGPRKGDMWLDGDLGYDVAVSGNTFIQTGGDAGYVTGAFFGAAHEAMGGTLKRSDLIAAFGGTR